LRYAGLVGASHRRGGPTTTKRDQDARPAPDLVDRNFKASGPDQVWVADITYAPTATGFLYLAVVLDAWSRKIVGRAVADRLRAELVLDAMEMGDCREFRVWLVMMGKKELPHGPTQSAADCG
jgi:putative transposase